jgi:hypothetical protein
MVFTFSTRVKLSASWIDIVIRVSLENLKYGKELSIKSILIWSGPIMDSIPFQ